MILLSRKTCMLEEEPYVPSLFSPSYNTSPDGFGTRAINPGSYYLCCHRFFENGAILHRNFSIVQCSENLTDILDSFNSNF